MIVENSYSETIEINELANGHFAVTNRMQIDPPEWMEKCTDEDLENHWMDKVGVPGEWIVTWTRSCRCKGDMETDDVTFRIDGVHRL